MPRRTDNFKSVFGVSKMSCIGLCEDTTECAIAVYKQSLEECRLFTRQIYHSGGQQVETYVKGR